MSSTPSMREIFISSIIMRVAAAAPRLHQISRFIMIFSVVMGQIMAETPTTISRLKMFEPITLLKAMSLLPESPAEMLTAASGALVPMATMVSPIITDGTFSSFATDEAPSTKKSAPLISRTKPTTSKMYIIKIASVFRTEAKKDKALPTSATVSIEKSCCQIHYPAFRRADE